MKKIVPVLLLVAVIGFTLVISCGGGGSTIIGGGNPYCIHDWNWATYVSGDGPNGGIRKCQRGNGCTATAGVGDTGPGGVVIFQGSDLGAWYQSFSSGDQGYNGKNNGFSVCAIRAFQAKS